MERGSSDVKAMKSVFKVLENDEGILIFPEGTRTSDGNLQPVKKGVGMLACRGQAQFYQHVSLVRLSISEMTSFQNQPVRFKSVWSIDPTRRIRS